MIVRTLYCKGWSTAVAYSVNTVDRQTRDHSRNKSLRVKSLRQMSLSHPRLLRCKLVASPPIINIHRLQDQTEQRHEADSQLKRSQDQLSSITDLQGNEAKCLCCVLSTTYSLAVPGAHPAALMVEIECQENERDKPSSGYKVAL